MPCCVRCCRRSPSSDENERPNLRSLVERVEVIPQNPFQKGSPWTCREYVKLLVLGPILFPPRLIILSFSSFWILLISVIVTVGVPVVNDRGCLYTESPISGWRLNLLQALVPLFRLCLGCFGFWRIKIIDRRADRRSLPNVIVVAPHMTIVDQLMLYYAFPPMLCGVADKGIIRVPLLGRVGTATQSIFVDLQSADSREACKELIALRADANQWSGWPIMIFPEGRLTKGGQLIQFKLGAFMPGQPVLPVVLRYPFRHFNLAGHSRHNRSYLWPLRAMTQVYNQCEVEVLEVYSPTEAEHCDAALFAHGVREEMARALGVPTTQHSYADAALFREAMKAQVFTDFEVQSIERMFEIDTKQLKECLKTFTRIDRNGDGKIDRREFVRWLRWGPLRNSSFRERHRRCWPCGAGRTWMNELFTIFDTDGSGYIEFRELIQGLALFSGRCSEESKVKLAFLLYDKGETGRLVPNTPGVQELLAAAGQAGRETTIDLNEFRALAYGQPNVLESALEKSSLRFPKI